MPLDILTKIRQLLGGDKSQKRKAPEENSAQILKRFREASQTNVGQSKLYSPYENTTRYDPLNKGRRCSDFVRLPTSSMKNSRNRNYSTSNHMLNHESTPLHSPQESRNSHRLNNGGSTFIEDDIQIDHRYQTQRTMFSLELPQLQAIHTTHNMHPAPTPIRQVPSLIRANGVSNQRNMNDSTSIFSRSNIPELFPIQRPVLNTYNGGDYHYQPMSSTHQPRPTYSVVAASSTNGQLNHAKCGQPAFGNFPAAKQYFVGNNSLSLKQNVDHLLKENDLFGKKALVPEKNCYKHLLDLLPFYNKSAKSKGIDAKEMVPQPQEIIDLASENEESMVSNTSSIEPVNTLRTRMETKPVYGDKWIVQLNEQYSHLSQSRSEEIRAEKERSTAAEQSTRDMEKTFLDRMKSLEIDAIGDLTEEEEEEYNDFPALSDEQLQKVHQWFIGRDTSAVLNTKFNLSITRHDIHTLSWEPLAWLNDEVINFYMELLGERSRNNDSLPKVHGMNTFFLKRLMETGYSGVRRWTRKVDLFAHDIIPVPVHKGIHWCMAIIHMRNKTIKYYDSMGAPNNVVLSALSNYLQSESLDKKKVQLDMSEWTFENVPNIPQQENGSDCGVFSCMYAEFITRNRPITFTQQHMQYFRKRMIYEICTGEMIV